MATVDDRSTGDGGMTGREALDLADNWGELAAVLYLLDTPMLRRKGADRYVSATGRTFDHVGMLEECGPWSGGERLLIDLACDLWGGVHDEQDQRISVSPRELADRLDDGNFARALTAMAAYRGLDLEVLA